MKWVNAESLKERKRIAREIQQNSWNFVPCVLWGQWVKPGAMRANIKGVEKT